MKFKWYKIPFDTEVEIINKDSRYFRRKGRLGKEEANHHGCNVRFDNGFEDVFGWNEFLPTQNILVLDKLDAKTLSQIFNPNYLYETNRAVIYLGKFMHEDIEKVYKKLAEQLAFGKSIECCNAEYVLALLNEMLGYDTEEMKEPIGEMITFVQWWVEGLRNHVTCEMKNRRYFETEHFQIDFIDLEG